jgi:hypothetical protein
MINNKFVEHHDSSVLLYTVIRHNTTIVTMVTYTQYCGSSDIEILQVDNMLTIRHLDVVKCH